jgi:polyferredoxin
VQIFFFVLIALISINHFLHEAGGGIAFFSSASLHALCPFGGVVSLYELFTAGGFVQKIHESSLVLMILVFITAILFGPVFCGWVCPFGSFQEWIGKIGQRIFGKKYNAFVPFRADRVLRFLRYVVLLWVLYVTAGTAKLIFADYDPYYALFNFWTGEVAPTALAALALVVILTLFVERPFCKYACPYGAVLGLFNLIRPVSIKRNDSTCINCKLCDRACPMNIRVSMAKNVRNHQCISCLQCTSEYACPIPSTVELMSGSIEALAPPSKGQKTQKGIKNKEAR